MEAYIAQAKQRYGDLADTFLKLYPVASDADVPLMNAQAQNDEINWNMRQSAALQSKKGKKGYAYFFTRVPLQNGQPSAARRHAHGGNLVCVQPPVQQRRARVERRRPQARRQMSSYWVNFMTKGDPNGAGLPNWPQYKDIAKDRVIVLGDTVQVETSVPTAKLAFFNARHARLMRRRRQLVGGDATRDA